MTRSKTKIRPPERGRRWDGKSRPSTENYKKNYNEITWGNMDEIAKVIKEKYDKGR